MTPGMNGRILILDDEPSHRDYFRICLRGTGFECVEAQDDESAIKILGRQQIDLVIQNMGRPPSYEVQGCEFIRQLRAESRFREVPVLIISAGEEGEAKEFFRRTGVSFAANVAGYLRKDNHLSRQKVVDAIEAILRRHAPALRRFRSVRLAQREGDIEPQPSFKLKSERPPSILDIQTHAQLEKHLPVWKRASEEEMGRREKAGCVTPFNGTIIEKESGWLEIAQRKSAKEAALKKAKRRSRLAYLTEKLRWDDDQIEVASTIAEFSVALRQRKSRRLALVFLAFLVVIIASCLVFSR